MITFSTRSQESHRLHTTTALQDAYGDFLRRFDWDWFVSLTFSSPVTKAGAEFLFKKFFSRLQVRTQGELSGYYVIERGALGTFHIHALINGIGHLPIRCSKGHQNDCTGCATHDWPHGYAVIRKYFANGAAAYYVAKQVALGRPSDWGIIGNPVQSRPRKNQRGYRA